VEIHSINLQSFVLNNALAPSLERRYGDYYILWFSPSNTYSVVDNTFKLILDLYLDSDDTTSFRQELNQISVDDTVLIAEQLDHYLKTCHTQTASAMDPSITFNPSYRQCSKVYAYNDVYFTVYYESPLIEKAFHPAIAHLELTDTNAQGTTYAIYIDKGALCLFEEEQLLVSAPKRDYHLAQGAFKMALFNLVHNTVESDWLATIHGSTITDGKSAILFIGNSGSGKSTLCSLLVAHGFTVLADDISPLLKADGHIYYNPSAISIKEKAFNILEPLIPELTTLPKVNFNSTKGVLKYIPCPPPLQQHYPCKTMVLVNYTPNSETVLESISVKDALETFIPDSWLHPGKEHAQSFLGWLSELSFYKLTYSDIEEMKTTVSELFKNYNRLS
jgi:putative ribosome biogenesis GTPase RsgA